MSKKEKVLTRAQKIERSLDTEFKFSIWHRFIEALGAYKLVNDGDKVCVCISGGKDSMLLALLFKHLKRYSKTDFEVKYLIMNPGYNDENFQMIKKQPKVRENFMRSLLKKVGKWGMWS